MPTWATFTASAGSAGPGLGTNKFSGLAGGGVTAGNRLGFKGEEALGNGLKAVLATQYGLELDNNSGIGNTIGGLDARQQFVGLASNYGTVALGRQYAPGFNATANNDALEATDMGIQSSLSVYAGNTITPNSPARYNNSISYTSNNLSGFTASAIYGFGESDLGGLNNASVYDNSQYGLGLNYANGPINFDAVWQSQVPVAVPNTVVGGPAKVPGTSKSINEWYLGGSYDFKVVKVYASYQGLDNKNQTGTVTGGYGGVIADENDIWTVGLTVPVFTVGTIGLSYGQLSTDNGNNVADGDSWGWGAMYTPQEPVEAHRPLRRLHLFRQRSRVGCRANPGRQWWSRHRRRRKQLHLRYRHPPQLLIIFALFPGQRALRRPLFYLAEGAKYPGIAGPSRFCLRQATGLGILRAFRPSSPLS